MEKRSSTDRRSIKDRRKAFNFHSLFYRGEERRSKIERRSQPEKRDGWVRVSKWSSVYLQDLKIATFLK